MLERAIPLLLLFGFPTVVVSQTHSFASQPAVPPKQVDSIPAFAERQGHPAEKLKRLIASRDALTKEIQHLRRITGQHQHVILAVKVCELSLNKARNANINVEGVGAKWQHANGFGGALAAGLLDDPERAEEAKRVEIGSETFHARVIDSDENLQMIVAELAKTGALKILTEPTLATLSGHSAALHFGGEFPVPVPQSNGDSTVEFREFGTWLDVVPVVFGPGRIRLDLRSRISEVDSGRGVALGDLTVPRLRVREVDTVVEMSVGQTLVLAGLVQQRVVPREESDGAHNDNNSVLTPSKTSEGNTDSSQDETEETELIVVVRAEILDAPTLAR